MKLCVSYDSRNAIGYKWPTEVGYSDTLCKRTRWSAYMSPERGTQPEVVGWPAVPLSLQTDWTESDYAIACLKKA